MSERLQIPVVYDLDAKRENVRLREVLADALTVIDDLLEAPYRNMTPWAVSTACTFRDHPCKPKGITCYCGREKYPEPTA